MNISINGKWRHYPADHRIIGKVRNIYFVGLNKIDLNFDKNFGYSYHNIHGFTINTFSLYLFTINWGTGYETHKDNIWK